MALLELSGITKTYGSGVGATEVLHGINFSIEEGEFVSVMGPSGSGKSTLLHIIGFLDKPTSGKYLFSGKNSLDYSEDELAQIRNQEMGFVFQAFNLLPKESVYENVELPLQYSQVPSTQWKKRVDEAVELVGLSHRHDFETYKLSGGEKQRVAIARALVTNPQIIFADEPTGNLDSSSGRIVMETLQELTITYGHTVMLITHETSTAEHAERIIRLKDGNVQSDEQVAKQLFAKEGYGK